MKNLFLILLSFVFFQQSIFSKSLKWRTIELSVPDEWKSKKIPMPSVSGYFLETTINKNKKRFFINSHIPDAQATKKGGDRYFKEYLEGFGHKGSFECKRNIKKLSYECHSFVKKNNKWSLKYMYWYQDKERLLVNLDDISTLGEAKSIYKNLKVTTP